MDTISPSIQSEYRELPLTRGLVALVDVADFEWLNQWKWYAQERTDGGFYGARNIPRAGGKSRKVSLHREILGLKRGDRSQVDHANLNPLDNRRSNLRIASPSQNSANRARAKSGLKGAYYAKDRQKWFSSITVNYRQMYLGSFDSEELAHAAYCAAAEKYFGEFARAA